MPEDQAAEAATLKEQANAEFQGQNFLKAAALYTKAIKLDPTNAVLYSNRSAALLKLKKVTKAMEDAEECIKLRPEWEKGYFRKGAVLEEQENLTAALEVYQHALKLNPDNKELSAKTRILTKMVNAKKTAKTSSTQPTESSPQPDASSAPAAAPAAPPPAEPKEEDLGTVEVAAFAKEYLEHTALEIRDSGTGFHPMIHFLPGPGAESHEEQETHINGGVAFSSPETLTGFVDFVRSTGERLDAQAVLAALPKPGIAVPQTWMSHKWPCGSSDGVFVQLESKGPKRVRKLWFIEVGAGAKEPGRSWSLDVDTFGPLPTLLR
mmetsp:Transcript_24998/g.54365  ORF Transcript_24998/g.54365 Transcript_24998/m.54365 type:complete len:322 (+) Transcript_24998:211-1176(+)